MGCSAMRESTLWNQAKGSIFTSSQEATKLRSTTAVWPPRSLPKNVQLLRPTAQPRRERSVWLLSIRPALLHEPPPPRIKRRTSHSIFLAESFYRLPTLFVASDQP